MSLFSSLFSLAFFPITISMELFRRLSWSFKRDAQYIVYSNDNRTLFFNPSFSCFKNIVYSFLMKNYVLVRVILQTWNCSVSGHFVFVQHLNCASHLLVSWSRQKMYGRLMNWTIACLGHYTYNMLYYVFFFNLS